jgi:hypothetical protein
MAVMDVGARLGDEERWSAALDRLLVLRETVAEVIDLPTAARTRAMLAHARGVLADGRAAGNEAVAASCRQLTEELNVLSWLVPGTRAFDDAIGVFRHHLLAHLELVRDATRRLT